VKVRESIQIPGSPESVWAIISDPGRVLSFMSGVTRWEVADERRPGLGARYRMLFRIGAAEVGGLIEVVEWVAPSELAWTSVSGLDQRGRWRLRDAPGGRTRVALRFVYGIPGSGLSGWLAERLAARSVAGHLRRSLQQLRRITEHEELRKRAAHRRAAGS
jgi:uncharacterized membrane protein